MREDIVKKFLPVSVYDVGAMESYLTDMAAEGYMLKAVKNMAHFVYCTPVKAAFRLEPFTGERPEVTEEKKELYKQFGWEYVTEIRNLFHIYMSTEENPVEIHTDPVTQGYTYEMLNKKLKRHTVFLAGVILIYFAFIFSIWFFNDYPVYYEARNGQFGSQLAFLLLYGGMLLVWVRASFMIRRTMKTLKEGLSFCHSKGYKRRKIAGMATAIGYVIAVLILYGNMMQSMAVKWEENLDTYKGGLPFVTLEEIEENPQMEIESSQYEDENSIYGNSVIYKSTFLAPDIYEINQRGSIAGEMWNDGSGEYSPNLNAEYYRLISSVFSNRLAEDILNRFVLWRGEQMISEELTVEGCDRAIYAEGRHEDKYLIAVLGDVVIYIDYQGRADIKKSAAQFIQAAAEF